jgi:hypothetical protein
MNITNEERKVNSNVFWSKVGFHRLTLTQVGRQLDPPVSRSRVCQILRAGKPHHRLQQIAKILGSNIQTLFPKVADTEEDKAA